MLYRRPLLFALSCFLGLSDAVANYKDDIGYIRLVSELGTNIPTGVGIAVSHIEASVNTNFPVYLPDTTNSEFTGKTILDVTGSNSLSSSHATLVGRYFYGYPLSVAHSTSTIDVYFADAWLEDGFLRSSPNLPRVESRRVQNHSWIGSSTSPSAEDKLVRLDYAINRDGFTCAVGLNNGSNAVIPLLMGSGYHSISVGLSSGAHSKTPTVYGGAGRMKPELVAPSPENATSFATPQISSCAAILLQVADDLGLGDAGRPQTLKAILMAGATKQEFPSWDRTHARPIDDRFGAGELNVYQSYHILAAGQQAASETNAVAVRGWDYQSLNSSDTIRYYLNVPAGHFLHRFSFLTTWHRIITDTQPGPPVSLSATLNNVDAFFYTSTNFTPDVMMDWSTSQVDNAEHIYQPILSEGEYVVELQADGPADCGIAWFGTLGLVPVAAPGALTTNGSFSVQATVSSNLPYQIEAATNLLGLVDWETIYSGSSTSGVLEFLDADATNFTARFYRFLPEP